MCLMEADCSLFQEAPNRTVVLAWEFPRYAILTAPYRKHNNSMIPCCGDTEVYLATTQMTLASQNAHGLWLWSIALKPFAGPRLIPWLLGGGVV